MSTEKVLVLRDDGKRARQTPLEWKLQRGYQNNGPDYWIIGQGAFKQQVCTLPIEHEADARFIVQACNAHHELMEACLAIVEQFGGYPPATNDRPLNLACKALTKAERVK